MPTSALFNLIEISKFVQQTLKKLKREKIMSVMNAMNVSKYLSKIQRKLSWHLHW
jgi:hypothetical protein